MKRPFGAKIVRRAEALLLAAALAAGTFLGTEGLSVRAQEVTPPFPQRMIQRK